MAHPLSPEERLKLAQAGRLRRHRLSPARPLRDVSDAAAFVRERGIVTETGHTGVPVLAHAIAGRALVGSWMAAPEVHRIYDLLVELADHDLEWVDLLDGKSTILDPSLAPAVQRVASDPERRAKAAAELPPAAARLFGQLERDGEVRMDRSGMSTKEGRAARIRLERLLLAVSDEIHTETGAHAAVLKPWAASRLARRHATAATGLDLEPSMDQLLTASLAAAVVVAERDARKWFGFAPDRLEVMVEDGRVERLVIAPRQRWLLPGPEAGVDPARPGS